MRKKSLFTNLCDSLVFLHDYLSALNQKINRFFETRSSALFYRFPAQKEKEELIQELGYAQNTPSLTKANKCYIALISPLIAVVIVSVLEALYSWMFVKNTTLFFHEYIKLIMLIPLFLLLFVWLLPYVFFKSLYPHEKRYINVYTYGTIIAIFFPLLVIPQYYHHYMGKPVKTIGTVLDKSTHRKSRSITFLTEENRLHKLKLRGLSQIAVEIANSGDKYLIKGTESKFYFTYTDIIPIKEAWDVYKIHQ